MSRIATVGLAILCGTLAVPARAQVADHLKCYKIKDSAPKATYMADLGGLAAEPGCRIAVPGKMLCVETAKSLIPPPPPTPSAGPAGRFLCYKVKCAKGALAPVAWSDQFGSRSVTPIGAKLLCAPETPTTTTTTTTAPPSCTDGMKNGNETDVDCGGSCAQKCATGQMCLAGADCVNGVCSGGTCQPATCTDGVKNGNETAVDCGGTCPGCANGQMCGTGSDCLSGVCAGGICQANTCTDLVLDGTETDVDCGGGTCPACATGKMCFANSDCMSNMCSGGSCL
jgi:hypothetical protein